MTALSTLIEPLKRELAVPGTFATIFPDTQDSDLLGALADAFAEAQLYRFFPTTAVAEQEADPDASPPLAHDWLTAPDLSGAGAALVVIYASMKFIRAQIRNLNTAERYKAGPVEFETQRAATTLASELAFLQKRIADLIAASSESPVSAGMVKVFDSYIERGGLCPGGFYAHEYH